MFDIFIYIYFGCILASFFAQGRWGSYFRENDLVGPVPVAVLWPIGLLIAAIAAPFAAAYFLGTLSQHKRGGATKAPDTGEGEAQ